MQGEGKGGTAWIAVTVTKTEDSQTIWRCRICGYEYVGEELPDDFICPLCKHPASDFEKVVKENGGKRDGSKQICRNTDREEFTGGICRGITGKK